MKKTALTLILISACFALTGEVNKQVEEIGNAVLDKLDQAKKDIIDGYNDISEKITENVKTCHLAVSPPRTVPFSQKS